MALIGATFRDVRTRGAMSDAAKEIVKRVTPRLRGSRLKLLETLAGLVIDGETMTPPVSIQELATATDYANSSMQEARDDLVDWKLVRMVGGGPGKSPQYELLLLPGAGAIEPTLPLLGEARRSVAQSSGPPPSMSDLFTAGVAGRDEPNNEGDMPETFTGFRWKSWANLTGFRWIFFSGFLTYLTGFRWKSGQPHRFPVKVFPNLTGFRWIFSRSAVDVDSRARDEVRTKDLVRDTHTHTGADAPPPELAPEKPAAAPSRAPLRHPNHAHCGVKFCVPNFLEEQFRQQSGWSAEQLLVHYRRWDTDAIRDGIKIGDSLKWLRARFAATVGASLATAAPRSPPKTGRRPDIQVARSWHCPHGDECDDFDACADRQIADSRARQRSG